MPELSDVATNCPDEVSTLKQTQSTPDIADSLSPYVIHDEALASAHVQAMLNCWDGNGCQLTNKAHGEWFRIILDTPSLHNNVQCNLMDRGELGD